MNNYLSADRKKEIFKEYGGSETNTGSTEALIAICTERINYLSGHLKTHKKDHSTRRALLQLVGKRKRFLQYLAKKDIETYRGLLTKLNIRK